MSSLIQRIDAIIEEQSLLKHKFYVKWNEGTLSKESLSGYSKEYFQLVKAVPAFVGDVIKKSPSDIKNTLAMNRDEEIEHIEPWVKFSEALVYRKMIYKVMQVLRIQRRPFQIFHVL